MTNNAKLNESTMVNIQFLCFFIKMNIRDQGDRDQGDRSFDSLKEMAGAGYLPSSLFIYSKTLRSK